jgi:hypothetical protein
MKMARASFGAAEFIPARPAGGRLWTAATRAGAGAIAWARVLWVGPGIRVSRVSREWLRQHEVAAGRCTDS